MINGGCRGSVGFLFGSCSCEKPSLKKADINNGCHPTILCVFTFNRVPQEKKCKENKGQGCIYTHTQQRWPCLSSKTHSKVCLFHHLLPPQGKPGSLVHHAALAPCFHMAPDFKECSVGEPLPRSRVAECRRPEIDL